MTDLSTDLLQLEPEAFFAHARQRLERAAGSAAAANGDHALNPGILQHPSPRDAAVLIPIIASRPLSVLFTLRTPSLSAHAGQVAFPGGKIDPGDRSAMAAALREANEEIGLDQQSVSVLGALDPYVTATGYRVVPIVGRVPAAPVLTINRDEVDEVFEVPLAFLMDPANMARASRVFGGRERHFYETEFEGHIIWGATAGIIVALRERLFG